jgi:hypothetical protein
MPSRDYADLPRVALEADPDVDELRARLVSMSVRQLLECGCAAAYMCTPHANLGQPPPEPLVMQLKAARAELLRRQVTGL